MSTLVFLVVLGSALLHAIWNAIIKGGNNKLFETVMNTTGGGLVALVALFFLPAPHPESWPYLAATCAIHIFYYSSVAYAYAGADLAYAYTLMRGASPLITSLVAVFLLGDTLGTGGWLGIAMLSAGILALAADSLKRGSLPVKVTLIALGNAFVIMGYTVVDGSGVRLSGNAITYVCWVYVLNALPLPCFVYATRWRAYASYVRSRWHYGLFGGSCSVLAYGCSLWGMMHAPIATVAALRETSVLFGMVLGVLFLHERLTPARVLAIGLVIAGAMVTKMM